MTETRPKKSKIDLGKLFRTLGKWILALIGTAGVTVLLMIFAGYFSPKVVEKSGVHDHPMTLGPETQVVAVQVSRIPRFERAVGSIEPIHKSALAAKILAKVTEANITAGQVVNEGDVLIRLNDEDLQSRLKQSQAAMNVAQAAFEQAKKDLDRAQQLIQQNAISKSEFEAAQTAVKSTAAQVDQSARMVEEARVFLGYATITAPFSGIIVDKQVQNGDTVSPGQTLLTIYDPDQMQLVANVRESFAMRLKVGQKVTAKLESMDHECQATVREVVPQAESGSRSFQVKVSGPCPPGIYSGMFGRILLPMEDELVTWIPKKAVIRVGQLTMVDVVVDQQPLRRNVQLGRDLDENIEVLSGLKAGEYVALRDQP